MAETTGKRFDINEKSSTNRRVGKTYFRMDCTKRALNVVRIDKQNTGLIHVTNLFPYSPVLDLLHAHGDSPEERCSSRLVPFAIRTRFAPSVRKSAIPLFPLPKWQYAQNPCPIRLSAGGGGAKSASLNSFRRTKSALTHRTTAKEQRLLFRHTATNIFANYQNRHLAVSQIKFNTS